MQLTYLRTCCFNFWFLLNILCKKHTILSKWVFWTEAAFSPCLAWHWPDLHWQCNWRVAWTSSRMYAGKTHTLRATIVTIFSHMTRDISVFIECDTIFMLFFWKLPQFHTSDFRRVMRQRTEGMVDSITWVLFEIYLAFQQWKNFENPLRIDKVITMSLVYYFFGTQCILKLFFAYIHLFTFLVSWAWWDWPSTWLTNHHPSVLWHCWLGNLTCKIVFEMTYNVSSGTLNPAIHITILKCL